MINWGDLGEECWRGGLEKPRQNKKKEKKKKNRLEDPWSSLLIKGFFLLTSSETLYNFDIGGAGKVCNVCLMNVICTNHKLEGQCNINVTQSDYFL